MKISEYYPEGDEKALEKQIKNILAKYFPNLSLRTEIIQNQITENENLKNEQLLNASISFSISMEQKEIKPEEKIDEISLRIEESDKWRDKTLTSEIFLG